MHAAGREKANLKLMDRRRRYGSEIGGEDDDEREAMEHVEDNEEEGD